MLDPRELRPDERYETRRAAAWCQCLGLRRLLSAVLGHGIHDPAVWGRSFQVPRRLSDAIGPLPRLTQDRVVTSPLDGFEKISLPDPRWAGSRNGLDSPPPPRSRQLLCLSSQVGCAMGCVFCATAKMEKRRNSGDLGNP